MPQLHQDPEFAILTPSAMLGYGYSQEQFWLGIQHYSPAAIIVDSGSTDGGPYKLGMNKTTCARESYKRDLTPMLEACQFFKVKLLIGSAGGDGSNSHVDEMTALIEEIANEHKWGFKIAVIKQDMKRNWIKERVRRGMSSPCGPLHELDEASVDRAVEIVGQMGAEPYIDALAGDPEIIIGGRAYDPSPFAGYCMWRGVEPSVAWHMGKIMECGGICSTPKSRSMIARMHRDCFELTPLDPASRCTSLSVAAHTLYEKTRPDQLPGPGGILSLTEAKYEELTDGRTVRVSGASFLSRPYQVKLEGVERIGHRTIFIGGVRDRILISQIDEFLENVRKNTQTLFPDLGASDACQLKFQIYGRNAVMGELEPEHHIPLEIGVLGECVAPTRERSYAIANSARISILHMPYEGQMATTGNFASPLSPHEQDAGEVFKFSVYHLIDLQHGEETSLFPISYRTIGSESPVVSSAIKKLSKTRICEMLAEIPRPIQRKTIPHGQAPMKEIASVIRSKNSGPFEITLDVMFDSTAAYQRVKDADVLNRETIKKLYRVRDDEILTNMFFAPALAWKATIKRPWAQGSFGERDCLGTQQHAPLLDIMVPHARTDSPMADSS